uniref:Uncharacterized protein n=1 Tax=Arundo donax TaxID=35708 RepID=A0A0A9FVR0_ARUDO
MSLVSYQFPTLRRGSFGFVVLPKRIIFLFETYEHMLFVQFCSF